jgi:hypothetical protein
MTQTQIDANEMFFTNVLQALGEGGTYGWPSENEIFIVHEGKLTGKKVALEKISKIVSPEFFKDNFKLLK